MKNHLRMALAALLLLMGGAVAFAQQKISGTIVDLSGQPVIGASVMIPGTTTGTVTNDEKPRGIVTIRVLFYYICAFICYN